MEAAANKEASAPFVKKEGHEHKHSYTETGDNLCKQTVLPVQQGVAMYIRCTDALRMALLLVYRRISTPPMTFA